MTKAKQTEPQTSKIQNEAGSSFVESVVGHFHNPDVLSCLANLSNDEVFTPPNVVNRILDALPQELFSNPGITFLDPVCKSGVFLREIAKRLILGLQEVIPNLNERLDHIYKRQLYGIAITEITSLVARRTLYCSLRADSDYAIVKFDNPEGNIRFQPTNHVWVNGKCRICGASEAVFGDTARRENKDNHAYELIHHKNPKDIFDMKFDVIVGNPPYQLSDGGNNASASPLYDKFVEKAIRMSPDYLTMIIKANWFSGGKGLDEFRNRMLNDHQIRVMVDYFDSKKCFPSAADISGGVCYFCWQKNSNGKCKFVTNINGKQSTEYRYLRHRTHDFVIRFHEAISIVDKVTCLNEKSFSTLVSARKPFGLPTTVKVSETPIANGIKVYRYRKVGFVNKDNITSNKEWIQKYKACIAYSYGERGDFPYRIIGKPFVSEPGSCCSETYLVINPCDSLVEIQNTISYMRTKFFRFLVLLLKNTQHATNRVYFLVPVQDFTKSWTDEELYRKYNLTDDEISFIESMILPNE